MLNLIHSIVHWLDGKKGLIAALAGVVISYLVTDGTITAALGTMLQSIVALLSGGAVAVGTTQSYKDYKLGKAK